MDQQIRLENSPEEKGKQIEIILNSQNTIQLCQ